MQQNWWEQYEQVAPAGQAPQSAPPRSTGYIPGVPKAPDPLALRREERMDDSAERAADAADRSANAQERAARTEQARVYNDGIKAQADLRKEFEGRDDVTRFGKVRAAREQIRALVNKPDPTAQDDLAFIFSFMRALDPNSVVRETEFATAQNAASVPEQIRNQYNKILSGERLSPNQRREFGQTVDNLYKSERETYNSQANRYREMAELQGINPGLVARRYLPDEPAPVAPGATPTPTQSQRPIGEIQFGAEPGGMPAGAREYQAEIENGIRSGTITTAEQVADVARKYRYAPPDMAQTEAMFEALRNGANYGGALAPEYQSVQDQRGQLAATRGDAIVDPLVRGAADTLTMGFADEISGIGNAIATGGNVDENIALQRGVDDFDEQRNFLPRISGQIAGGFGLPIPAAANTVGRLAGVGAGYGAAYGAGSADGSLADRLSGAATGGLVGGALGAAGGSLAQRLAARGGGGGGGNVAGREVADAARAAGMVDDQGRPLVMPADVGGPMTRRFTAGAAQSPFGAGPVNRAAERINNRAGERLSAIANAEGAPVRQEVFGETAQTAAQGYIDRTGEAARQSYGNARELANDTMVQGRRAFQNINAQMRELAPTASVDAPVISGLQRLRDVIASDQGLQSLSVDAIRRLRTSTAAEARVEGLRGTDYQRRANAVLQDLSEDIANQLPPEAAAAFRQADRAYAERLNTIDDVMTQVVGKQGDRSAEAVANRLIGLSRGDSGRLRTFLNSVEPEEAGIIRGSLIEEMGRANSGAQNAAGDGFSLQSFLTNWDKMPARTKDTLFRGEHRQSIEALARYAQAARETRTYANTSNTAGAVNASMVGRQAMSGTAAVGTLGMSAVVENLTGRLLGSRRFAQWLARPPRSPEGQAAWARRLSVIASREPALAPDIAPLQAALSASPGRAAASDEQQ